MQCFFFWLTFESNSSITYTDEHRHLYVHNNLQCSVCQTNTFCYLHVCISTKMNARLAIPSVSVCVYLTSMQVVFSSNFYWTETRSGECSNLKKIFLKKKKYTEKAIGNKYWKCLHLLKLYVYLSYFTVEDTFHKSYNFYAFFHLLSL